MGQAVHGCISVWHIAQHAHKAAALTRAQRGHQITVLAGLRWLADHHDLQVKVQQGCCFEQCAKAFLFKIMTDEAYSHDAGLQAKCVARG